jgi:hypothetical protein
MDEFVEPVVGNVTITETVELSAVQVTEAVGLITLDDEERFEI